MPTFSIMGRMEAATPPACPGVREVGMRSLLGEIRLRQLVRKLSEPRKEGALPIGLGLIHENGIPDWETVPPDEGHAFRRHVYEQMRFREQP